MKTLEEGRLWAQQQKDSPKVEGAIKRSRSTLVVVPSARSLFFFPFCMEEDIRTDLISLDIQLDERDKKVGLFYFIIITTVN